MNLIAKITFILFFAVSIPIQSQVHVIFFQSGVTDYTPEGFNLLANRIEKRFSEIDNIIKDSLKIFFAYDDKIPLGIYIQSFSKEFPFKIFKYAASNFLVYPMNGYNYIAILVETLSMHALFTCPKIAYDVDKLFSNCYLLYKKNEKTIGIKNFVTGSYPDYLSTFIMRVQYQLEKKSDYIDIDFTRSGEEGFITYDRDFLNLIIK